MTPLDLPLVPTDKLTPDVLRKIDALAQSLVGARRDMPASPSPYEGEGRGEVVPPGTLSRWKSQLRKMYGLARAESFESILDHPQLRAAIENIVVRSERSDKSTLRSGRGLGIVMPSGEVVSIENFLRSLYPRENVNATSCYRSLRALCAKHMVVDDAGNPIAVDALPAETSVIRFLKKFRREHLSVRRARSRKHDFDAKNMPFVSRDPNDYRAGQLWFGDHTEDDFVILNERGKLDRRWISAFFDMRTRVMVGYHLSWQPNSQTIALAFRNAVTGEQLHAYDGEKYVPVNIQTVPEEVEIDNGKDYRSKYTQRVFGKVDFDDDARIGVQRITTLHYSLPYHGQSKAPLERWFGTIHNIMKSLPGYKGSNARINQPDSLKDEIKQGEIMSVETYDKLFALAVDVYNNRIHRTLRNQTPLVCYLSTQTHQRSIDLRVLDFLMMKAEPKRIHRCEFTLFTKQYYSEALMEHDTKITGKKADVYYDPLDLGFVAVYVDKKFITVAVNKEMIGKDERGWLRILHDRNSIDRKMKDEVKGFRGGVSRIDAKMLLLEGELRGATPVPAELLSSNVPSVHVLTGLEGKAFEQQKELDEQKTVTEFEEHAKKNPARLTLAAVNKIR
jgi:transposase InsO family protein